MAAPENVEIHAFRIWSGGDQDPRNDIDRYRFLRGDSDNRQTIDPRTVRALDYRFLVSAGPFRRIEPESTLAFQVAFVCGDIIDVTTDTGTRKEPYFDTSKAAVDGRRLPPPPEERRLPGGRRRAHRGRRRA